MKKIEKLKSYTAQQASVTESIGSSKFTKERYNLTSEIISLIHGPEGDPTQRGTSGLPRSRNVNDTSSGTNDSVWTDDPIIIPPCPKFE